MEAQSVEDQGEAIQFNVFVYNVQPGVEIDYATGNSTLAGNSGTTEESSIQEYVLNKKSKKFHNPDCASVSTIEKDNKESYKGAREDFALRSGLVARERVFDREQLEGLRQAVQGFLYGEGPASYQQEFQCRRLLDQITAQLPERTQDQMQSESQKLGQSI